MKQDDNKDTAKLAFLCGQYAAHLSKLGVDPRVPGGAEDEIYTATGEPLEELALSHVSWMAFAAGRMEPDAILKASRWLGFIQGVLWSFGVFTIDDLMRHQNEGRLKPKSGERE
jgi:hypothetical protein